MDKSDRINDLKATAYTVPTDYPESDGTLEWDSTTLILAEVSGMGQTGIGYTYAHSSAAGLINTKLKKVVVNKHPFRIGEIFSAMFQTIRNEGHCGIACMGLSAVDVALWDLKSKILGIPLCELIGKVNPSAKVYGSGGFTSYPDSKLEQQLGGWAAQGLGSVKMKIGRHPEKDPQRVQAARSAIGSGIKLFIDANGAFSAKQALNMAKKLDEFDIGWFEEPVSSDDTAGLYFVRNHAPVSMQIAAGEYGYNIGYFRNMLQQGAVDVLQADATRCGGITGYLNAGRLCEAFNMPFSFHCAPALHLHPSLCLPKFCIGEYFHDHTRIEEMFFEGVQRPVGGALKPDLSKPGLGLTFKYQDAEQYKVS